MSVTNLSDYRKPKVKRNDISDMHRWWCVRCNLDDFKILQTGAVHCAQCFGLIRQLKAVDLS